MPLSWQDATAGVIVAAAAVYLLRVAWRSLAGRKTGGCTTCSTCPTSESDPGMLVEIKNSSRPASDSRGHPIHDG